MKKAFFPVKPIMIACLALAASCVNAPSGPAPTAVPPEAVPASEFEKAEKAFARGTFQEALSSYEKVFKGSADADLRHKSFFRLCESLTHLFRYGEAAQLILDTPLPDAAPERARILLLKAGLLESFVRQYAYLLSRNESEESGEGGKAFHLTREQVEAEIENAFESLGKMEDTLKEMALKDQSYYFLVEGVDFGMYPTLFDFYVLRRTAHLLFGQTLTETDISYLLGLSLATYETIPQAIKAAELMTRAAESLSAAHPESAEYWQVKRLGIVLDLGWNVPDQEKANALRDKAAALFTDLMDRLKLPGPKALAGFKAATLLNQRGKYVAARELCEKVIADFPGAPADKNAKALRQQLVNPYLYLAAATMTLRDQKKLALVTRNLKQVHFRAYKLKGDVLKDVENNPADLYGLGYGVSEEGLGQRILAGAPDHSWTADTGDPGKHEYLSLTVAPPALSEGIYLIAACDDPSFARGQTLWCSSLVNVTSLVLVGTTGPSLKTRAAYYDVLAGRGGNEIRDTLARYYAFDVATGKPAAGAGFFAGWNRHYGPWQRAVAVAGQPGAALELLLTVRPGEYEQYTLAPLAKRGDAYAYLEYPESFWQSQPDALEFFIETDRPIYRPGDKLKVKVAGVRRTTDGFRALDKGFAATLQARDPNGNVIAEKSLPLNDFGSADWEFEIPRGKLLGRYSLIVAGRRGVLSGDASADFQVEEYKRPEFEIVFDPIEQAVRFGRPAEITGSVKYYFGGAAAGADVAFTVTRSLYVPWYFRSWFWGGYNPSRKEKASGRVKTDDNGKFRIVFTPEAGDAELPAWLKNGLAPEIASYDLSVEARDSGGRTITGSVSCRVGKSEYYFTAEADKGFYFEKDKAVWSASKLSVNDRPLSGEADYEVYLLKDPPLRTFEEMGYSHSRGGSLTPGLPGPDFQLKDAENLKLIAQGRLAFGTDGTAKLTLLALPPGAYRLALKGKDAAGGEAVLNKIFLVVGGTAAGGAGRDVPLNLASVTLFEKDEYRVGDTARVLMGSRFTGGTYVMELWAGDYFVRSALVDGAKPVQAVSVPVTAEMKGGFTVRWFGVKGLDVHYGQADAAVPWSEKSLAVELSPFKDRLLPGEKATWGVRTKSAAGKPAPGEVLVLMYDRSLEYYATADRRGFASLYLPNPQPDTAGASDFQPQSHSFPVRQGSLYDRLYNDTRIEGETQPRFRTDRTAVYYRARGASEDKEMMFDLAPPAPATIENAKQDRAEAGAAFEGQGFTPEGPPGEEGQVPPRYSPMPAVQARQAFADTAFFLPHLVTDKNGAATFSFTAPEQLTGWKVKAFAFTKDASWGELEKEAVTAKDLMVRLDLPRFFREKDKGTVTAVVHNESDEALTGRLWIDVLDNGTSVLAAVKLADASKTWSVKAHGSQTFDWPVEIPAGIGAYTVKAAVKTESLSDAEERVLPILPSRQRLIESAFAVIRGSETKTIRLPAAVDPTRINESATLEIDPQLTLSLLHTLPFLIDYPYACVEQSLNKYVPLAIVNELYGKYPEVRKAVAKLPKRATVVPPWDEKDPLRQIQIDETPWGWEAKGRPPAHPVIDLLDPAIVAAQKESVFTTLRSSQLSSGAFPWWPGGREDVYMTLYVLAGLAEAKRYGAAIDAGMVNRALAWVNATVPEHFKPEPYQLALVAYASYVATSFPPAEYAEAAKSRELVASWLGFLYEHRFALTPFGKGYLAHVYFRLGDKTKGDEILAMALDGGREDAIAGVYWTPEAYSWVWYSDTVEKHAFFLKTLLEFKPDDKRIDGMARWLLWNRKGNVWKSTKASAAALYALLEYLAKGGSLFSDERYTIDWGATKEKVQVKGDDWQGKPLRFLRPEGEIGTDGLRVAVAKEGQGTSFASLTWIYSTDQLPQASGPGLVEVKRQFFVRAKEGAEYRLKEIKSGDEAAVGDQIEVKITINTKSQFEYMHLKDPKAAGFEAETLLSGWKYDPLWYYEEPRDSSTNFFLDRLPHGEYVLRYRLRPTKPGEYRVGAATLQSMYAPDLNAHSDGFVIRVKKGE